MRLHVISVLSGAVLAVCLTGMAQAENAPVTINACHPVTTGNSGATIAGISLASTSRGMQIQFTNESAKPADIINFGVDSNGQTFVIRDVGTFSPGIEITHRYKNGAGQAFILPGFIAPKVNCKVDSVRFTDGTLWRPGQPAVAAETPEPTTVQTTPQLSSTPASITISKFADSLLFMVSSRDNLAAFTEHDTCAGIAIVTLGITGESSAAYSVKPLHAGSCTATIRDEAGHRLAVPITVTP